MLELIVTLAVAPSTLNAIVRAVLTAASSRPFDRSSWTSPPRWLVVIPARAEGPGVEATVRSVANAAAATAVEVRILLLLDGPDQASATIAKSLGADVCVKTPAGPSKAAALRWLIQTREEELLASDAILLLDIGSQLSREFFDAFRWPSDAAASQAILAGSSEGVGSSAAAAERSAQSCEDRGRQRLGWNVRLRGTGSVFTPPAFLYATPLLRSQVEDEEATLVLAAAGHRISLAPAEATVFDEKPAQWRDAAGQRARWLTGRLSLFIYQAGTLARLLVRRPAEGLAFLLDLTGRPLTLSIPLRMLLGGWLVLLAWPHVDAVAFAGALAILSALADIAHLLRGGASPAAALAMLGSWLAAVALAPRALFRWIKVRTRAS